MRRTALSLLAILAAAAPKAADPAAPLLDSLHAAATPQQAASLEAQILANWQARITPAVQLLAQRATAALGRRDPRTAIGDLDAALDLQPDQADLWRLHAEARFANGDENGAFADLAQALSREPRCFPALADLSHFAESRQDYPRAIEAWQRLLDIDPMVHGGAARLAALQRKATGQPL
jgi:tetratricopeptide (TPR) repeat protein